jgi:OHCU decarboxylase
VSRGLERLNASSAPDAEAMLMPCCGSQAWVRRMAESRPFRDLDDLYETSDRIWRSLGPEDWLEAFAAHPRIGERGGRWARQEQAGAAGAGEDVLAELAAGNRQYEDRFGHIFIVYATGKSAEEMLALLRERLGNDPETELRIAAEEQRKITNLRLEKLLQS